MITITATSAGKLTASTNSVNGVSFSANTTIFAAGAGVSIYLTGAGTPLASGTFTYIVTLSGQTCTFNVTFVAPATFNCGTATQTLTSGGSATSALIQNTVYAGTFNIPYTAGNGSTYGTTTATPVGSSYGLTLTRTAGTYSAGGGTIQYTLSGTYTGTGSTVSFTTAEGCTVLYGDAIRASLSAGGCTSCSAYDAAGAGSWVRISAAEYNALANTANLPDVSKTMATDALMSIGYGFGAGTGYTITNTGPSNPSIPASSYVVAFRVTTLSNTLNATYKLKIQTSGTPNVISGPYTDLGTFTPTVASMPSGGDLYFVIKRPAVSTTSQGSSAAAIYETSTGGSAITQNNGSATTTYARFGDVSDLTGGNTFALFYMFQTLSTTTKSW